MTTVGKPFDFVDFLRHLALPALILGFGYMAIFLRYTRASMLDVIQLRLRHDGARQGPAERIVLAPARLPQRADPDHHAHRAVDPARSWARRS